MRSTILSKNPRGCELAERNNGIHRRLDREVSVLVGSRRHRRHASLHARLSGFPRLERELLLALGVAMSMVTRTTNDEG